MSRLVLIAAALAAVFACTPRRGVGFAPHDPSGETARRAAEIEAEYEALLVQRGLRRPVQVVEAQEPRPAKARR